jgi:PAS domain S-box-containing protein
MDEGVILFNNSYEIVFANDSALSILGYSKDEMSGFMHNLLHKNSCGEDLDGNECVIIHSVENNSSLHNGETYFFDKSGNKIPVAFNINRISGCSYSSGGILVFRDITGEKISKDRLLKSIEENKLLIKEIHHRVKNNLQIVSSLLSIQSGYLDNQKAVDYFNNSIQRIKSMALIHEMLYKGDQIKGLDFKQYISRLVNEISHSYANTFPIATEMNCENISISLDESVSLSLIMTEIVTNSFKHAFTEDMQNPRITINVFLDENGKRNIVIADNGKGFSDTNSFYTSGNLGAQIIQSLIEQIGGSLDLKNEGGAEFILKF